MTHPAPDDYRRIIPRYQDENGARNAELAPGLTPVLRAAST
jgi:hypothetical protein